MQIDRANRARSVRSLGADCTCEPSATEREPSARREMWLYLRKRDGQTLTERRPSAHRAQRVEPSARSGPLIGPLARSVTQRGRVV